MRLLDSRACPQPGIGGDSEVITRTGVGRTEEEIETGHSHQSWTCGGTQREKAQKHRGWKSVCREGPEVERENKTESGKHPTLGINRIPECRSFDWSQGKPD